MASRPVAWILALAYAFAPLTVELPLFLDWHTENSQGHDHAPGGSHEHGDADDHHENDDSDCHHDAHCCCAHPPMPAIFELATLGLHGAEVPYLTQNFITKIPVLSESIFHPPVV